MNWNALWDLFFSTTYGTPNWLFYPLVCLLGLLALAVITAVPLGYVRAQCESERVDAMNAYALRLRQSYAAGSKYGYSSQEYQSAKQDEQAALSDLHNKGGFTSL